MSQVGRKFNIQYDDEEELTLKGSFKSNYPSLDDNQMQFLNSVPDDAQNSTKTPPEQIVHTIEYGDTLEGLSLTYDVPIGKIKQRNKIQSDTIYYLKQIIIPNPRCAQSFTREQEQFMKIEEFMQHMSPLEKESKAARYYLSENGWDVKKAVKQYRQDLDWEKKNNIVLKSGPIKNFNPMMEMQLLSQKKNN